MDSISVSLIPRKVQSESIPKTKYPPPGWFENAHMCSTKRAFEGDSELFQSISLSSCFGGLRLSSKKDLALSTHTFLDLLTQTKTPLRIRSLRRMDVLNSNESCE